MTEYRIVENPSGSCYIEKKSLWFWVDATPGIRFWNKEGAASVLKRLREGRKYYYIDENSEIKEHEE